MLHMASRKHIPRGCRENYIPGLSDESKSLYEAYKKQYLIDPFCETTIDTGNTLIGKMEDEKKNSWEEVIISTDLTGVGHGRLSKSYPMTLPHRILQV